MAQIFYEGIDEYDIGTKILKQSVKETIPNFIHVGFNVTISDKEKNEKVGEIDALMLVPHLGVFLVEVIDGAVTYENGEFVAINRTGHRRILRLEQRTVRNRYHMIQFLRDNFGVTPLVHTIYYFVAISKGPMQEILEEKLGTVMFADDLKDELAFMNKIFAAYLADMHRTVGKDLDGSIRYSDDLDDALCEEIIAEWGFTEKWKRPEKPPFLFLSYCHRNKKAAFRIKRELERRGVYVWRAPEDVPLGEDYLMHEVQAIHNCDAFIILLSEASMASEEVWFEIETATSKGKKILPILIEECEITPRYLEALTHYEWREMFIMDTEVIEEIIRITQK